MIMYEAVCSCLADDHSQTLIVEVDEDGHDINVQIYSKIITEQFTSWNSRYEYQEAMSEGNYFKLGYYKAKLLIEHISARIRFTWDIWVNGYVRAENQFIFRNEAAIDDYVEAITIAKNKMKEIRNERSKKSTKGN